MLHKMPRGGHGIEKRVLGRLGSVGATHWTREDQGSQFTL